MVLSDGVRQQGESDMPLPFRGCCGTCGLPCFKQLHSFFGVCLTQSVGGQSHYWEGNGGGVEDYQKSSHITTATGSQVRSIQANTDTHKLKFRHLYKEKLHGVGKTVERVNRSSRLRNPDGCI